MSRTKETRGKEPYIPLYTADWERDTNMLSIEAEGGWLKIILKMWNQFIANKNGTKDSDFEKGVFKISSKGLQNLWRKNKQEVDEIVQELHENKVCDLIVNEGFFVFINRRMKREGELSKIRSKAVQTRYNNSTHMVQQSESEYINEVREILESSVLEEDDVDLNQITMVVVEMMKIWMRARPEYSKWEKVDYPALLNIAYTIAERKGWKKASVVAEREADVLKSFESISVFLQSPESGKFLPTLTLEGIAISRNFQKIEEGMRKSTFYQKQKLAEAEKGRIAHEDYFKD